MNDTLSVSNVSVKVGRQELLHGITLTAGKGRITGLVGPSGAGKTTLIQVLLGLKAISSGKVEVLGQAAGFRGLRRQIGYVTQAPAVYTDITVRENLTYFAALLGVGGTRVDEVIELVDLTTHSGAMVGTLSGGQLTRVSLGVALLGNPRLLLLDEPTVGLDPVLRERLWKTFRALAQAGTTILVSSHAMDEAVRCDELVFLRDGSVLAAGSPDAIMKQTSSSNMESAFLALAKERSS